jgi:hypothetical protein
MVQQLTLALGEQNHFWNWEHGFEGNSGWSSKCWGMSLSRLETSTIYPPFFTTLFFYAPQNARDLGIFVHYARKSILRKRVYSLKHSGNSRGGHRGPENVRVFCRSGRKMSDLDSDAVWASKIIKRVAKTWLCGSLSGLEKVSHIVDERGVSC